MEYDMVFEGGGAKGSVFVGALKELESRGHTIRRLVGTSAGAITATLLAAGYTPDELLEAANEKLDDGKPRFSSFMDTPQEFEKEYIQKSLTYELFKKVNLPWIPEMVENKIDDRIIAGLMELKVYRVLFSFIERGGLYEGDKFLEWIREKLNAETDGLGDMTLKAFFEETQKDLSLVASDTTGQEMLVLNHRTAPDCPVPWAVRMSMSIPFVWQEVVWQPEWGTYAGNSINDHTIVDGGVLSNFPINLLISNDPEVTALMGDTDPGAAETLGFLIDEKLPVKGSGDPDEGEDDNKLIDDIGNLRTVRRIRKLVDTMTNAHDSFTMHAHGDKICRLPAQGYGTTEFDMSDERLQALIKAGQSAMIDFFDIV